MDRINNIIADIMPKDLVLIDLEQDKSNIRIIVDGIKSVDFPSLISSYLTFSQRPNSILLQGSREIPNFLCSIKWIL